MTTYRATRIKAFAAIFGLVLVPSAVLLAGFTPGTGIKAGNLRMSPFAEFSMGYDDNVLLAAGEILPLHPDGSYDVQETKIDDFFTQFTVGLGVSRVLETEWDIRLRGWYDTRYYDKQTDIDYDSYSIEGSTRYWPVSDLYSVTVGGKHRKAQDVERVPASASLTMPGEVPLPYLEERDDRLKRVTFDGFAALTLQPGERTTFGANLTGSTVEYDDNRLFDYWNWSVGADAGYRFSEKTYLFVEGEYDRVEGDALDREVPVYALRLGFKTKPRVKIDYRISAGIKTYEYAKDSTGNRLERRWDIDFDGLLNWRYSERLSFFGKAWTDVGTAIQMQAPEDTRRTYAAQIGTDYAFLQRFNAVGALSYRHDAYDYPIRFGNDLIQEDTRLWQVMGRITLSPRANTFWKAFVESSYEMGDNDLDDYTQWLVWIGASIWY